VNDSNYIPKTKTGVACDTLQVKTHVLRSYTLISWSMVGESKTNWCFGMLLVIKVGIKHLVWGLGMTTKRVPENSLFMILI